VNVLERFRRRPDPDPEPDVWPSPSVAQAQIEAMAERVRLQQIERGRVYVGSLEDVCATARRTVAEWDAELRDVALSPECIHQLPTDVWDAIGKVETEMRALLAALGVAAQARDAVRQGAS
jgi:hypothetical protein